MFYKIIFVCIIAFYFISYIFFYILLKLYFYTLIFFCIIEQKFRLFEYVGMYSMFNEHFTPILKSHLIHQTTF